MASWLEELDPDVRQVLEDIAQQGSSLLRVDAAAPSIDPLERDAVVSWTRAGLGSAERHLLRARRDDLWLLLHRVYRLRKLEDPVALAIVPDTEASIGMTPERMRSKARRLSSVPEAPRDILEVIASGDLSRLGYRDLATAARRVLENDSTRLLCSSALDLTGAYDEALRVAAPIADHALRTDVRLCALTIAAHARAEVGAYAEALSLIEKALHIELECPDLRSSHFLLCLRLADWPRCQESGWAFERLYPLGSSRLTNLIEALRTRSSTGWASNERFLRRVSDSIGPATEALIHGLTA